MKINCFCKLFIILRIGKYNHTRNHKTMNTNICYYRCIYPKFAIFNFKPQCKIQVHDKIYQRTCLKSIEIQFIR
ncbi:hypothetical protein B5E60_12895 [Alistipes sp. An116]|nr:hypothetical protein B5E60_12895 [Alistipes sp. An116]